MHINTTNTTTTTTTSTTTAAPASADAPLTRAPLSVYAPRALPKIKRPVPINEKSKYDYTTKAGAGVPAPTSNPKEDEEYYYDDEEYDEPQPPPSKRKESGKNGRRRNQHAERKRPMRYEDEYEDEIEEEDERPRMRKGNNRKDDDFRGRNRGSQGKSKKGQREDDEPIPSERPGYISSQRGGSRKRQPESSRPERKRPDRRPAKGYDYYDEEDPEEDNSRYSDERRRPNSRSKAEKPRARPKKPTTTSTTTTSTTTTTTTTTTTPRPTPAPTSSTPASYEDEEYEEYEYEDDIILDKPKDENRKEIPPTTPAPHRFSTTGYRTQRLPSPSPATTTTTEQTVRRGTTTYRSRKPDYRRPPSSDETFSSQVGTPTGFKRPEEDNSKVKSSEQNNRGSYDDENKRIRVSEFPSRRPVTGTGIGFSSEDRRQVKPETSQPSVDSKSPTTRQEYPIPPAEVKPQGDSQGFFIRKPFKPQANSFSSKYLDDSSQRRPDSYELPVSGLSAPSAEDDVSYRKPQADPKLVDSDETNLRSEDKKQRIDYPVPPPQITQGPPLPPSSQTAIYRRPYVPTGPEGPRRPNEESQYRRQKPDPFSSPADGNSRRPFPSSAEGNSNKEEEQSYRRPQKSSYTPTGPEAFRRPSGPDGTSKSSLNYRRSRPEKEQKKTLEELAYPSRRPVQTQEPVTEPGPNYRNPFLSTRPVVEEPDYYKVNKEPALDFTAPGPSNDGSTQRPLSYDIGEEYDVTLNDALQPSTLNPTVQYSRVKTRGYQSAVTHPSYRSILVPAASQNYYSKTAVADQMEYETVVLPTARFTQAQARYKTPRRPNDWSYW
uniref:Uncharacterized protein n=1 Tax=Lygus hesperus TaxID=30085 RepID=A0A146MF67_LYGHE